MRRLTWLLVSLIAVILIVAALTPALTNQAEDPTGGACKPGSNMVIAHSDDAEEDGKCLTRSRFYVCGADGRWKFDIASSGLMPREVMRDQTCRQAETCTWQDNDLDHMQCERH